jgi:hypothetical protein
MQVTIRGKRWNLEFRKLPGGDLGKCDSPETPNKTIVVNPNQKGVDVLGTILHEAMHAAHWDLDEEAIDSASDDIAKILWRLGYRRDEQA